MSDEPIYVAYSRQSLSRVGDKGDSVSIADQFRLIEGYADRLGGRIVARYSDVDISGATESREGLDRLLADVKTIRPHAVIIRDVSRLARDTRIFLSLVDTLQRSNVKLLSATESLEDRTLATVISAISERERLALAGRVAGGVREHARRGKMPGRVAFGYRRIDGQMVIHEPEAAVVRRVFDAYAAGGSVTRIIDALNTDPAAPKPPETDVWKHDTISKMLRRSSYAGDVVIAARKDVSGRAWPAVVTPDAHPAIVPRAQFEAVQRRFAAPRPIVRQRLVSPFSGLLWCAHCGGRIYATEQQRPNRPANFRLARCGTRAQARREGIAAPVCPGVRGERSLAAVEALAVAATRRLLTERIIPADVVREHVAAELAKASNADDGAAARSRLADIERRRARLLDAYENGLPLETWLARDRLLGSEADALTAIAAAAPPAPDLAVMLGVRDGFARLSADRIDPRAVLTELGAKVIVDLDTMRAEIAVAGPYALLFAPALAVAP